MEQIRSYLRTVKPFVLNAPFLYPVRFSDFFRGWRKGALGTNGLSVFLHLKKSFNSYGHLQILFTIVISPNESNLLQGLDLV